MKNHADNHADGSSRAEAVAEVAGPRTAPGSLSERVRSLRLPEESARTRARGSWLPWVLCLLFAATTAALGGFVALHHNDSDAEKLAETAKPAGDATFAPTAAGGDVVLESKGYIIPAHQILVSPKVGGMAEKVHIIEGMRVKKGDVLAQLETTDYQADYDHTVGALAAAQQRLAELDNGSRPQEIRQAKAELDEAEVQRDQLYADFKRSSRLQINRTLAERDYEQAESAYKAMDRRVEKLRLAHQLMVEGPRKERILAAQGDVKQAEADLAKAKWRLDNCTIRAPVSGTILKKNAEEGNIVNAIAFNGSFSLCEMADLSDLEVDLSIQERDVSRVFAGQKCTVRAEAFPKREYHGVVSRLMPIADRAKGAVPVRVKLTVPHEEEGVYLKPEMGAVVSFLKGTEK